MNLTVEEPAEEMHRLKSSPSYLIAAFISLATLALIWALPIADREVSLVLLLTAVVVSAWLCGWRAGLLATAVCATASVCMQLTSEEELVGGSVRLTAFLSLSMLILTLALLRQEAEDSLARNETLLRAVLDHSTDPLSVSRLGQHQFVNAAYLRLFGIRDTRQPAPKPVLDVIAPDDRSTVLRQLAIATEPGAAIQPFKVRAIRGDGKPIELKIYISSFEQGGDAFVLMILRDITDRQQALREKELLIAELRTALSRVKELSGLLPTCASCRKIRDEEGAWHDMETYICEHSEAGFSHGLCPQCAERLYPEVFGSAAAARHNALS